MTILPLASEPFVPPSDRDMYPSERREFARTHRTCILGYGRREDGPAMTVVYYVPTTDGNLLVSTMADRTKVRAVERNSKVSLCLLDERWPFAFLQVYADATVERDQDVVVDVMMAVGSRITGQEIGQDARPLFVDMAERENRVVLRCRPYSTYATPPRHVQADEDVTKLVHWRSASMAWDAPDDMAG